MALYRVGNVEGGVGGDTLIQRIIPPTNYPVIDGYGSVQFIIQPPNGYKAQSVYIYAPYNEEIFSVRVSGNNVVLTVKGKEYAWAGAYWDVTWVKI